jgi:aminomethyltransferase
MTDFFGWSMPVQFSSITEEHLTVRRAAGLFDLGHMGRIRLSGPDRVAFAQLLTTVDVEAADSGTVLYGFLCDNRGAILDDITIYRADKQVLLVVNASNAAKVLDWLNRNRAAADVMIEDVSSRMAMIAIQGPQAEAIVQEETALAVDALRYYRFEETKVCGVRMLISRTGYTGEDGFELYMGYRYCEPVWNDLFERGKRNGLVPIGLGARDTLRLEAAMPLYGNELSEQTTPFEAGLGKFVDLEKPDFIGREALREQSQAPPAVRLCCLVAKDRCVPRKGYEVFVGEKHVGAVTSGTFSPTLNQGIAMAYLDVGYAGEGTEVEIAVRGRRHGSRVVRRPFYSRKR